MVSSLKTVAGASRALTRSTLSPAQQYATARASPILIQRPISTTRSHLSSTPPRPFSSNTSVGNLETSGFRPRPSVTGPGAVRVGTLFTSLIALAVAVTGYGLYEYYTSFSAWPVSIRDDLRAAIKARNRGDARRAETYFRKALATARGIKAELNEPTPTPKGAPKSEAGEAMLKISGIAIALAALLEGEGQVEESYNVLEDVWEEVMERGKYVNVGEEKGEVKRSDRDRMRAVQIAQKLGMLGQLPEVRLAVLDKIKAIHLGEQQEQGAMKYRFSLTGTSESQDPAEKWLVWSVEELFRLVLPAEVHASALAAAAAPPPAETSEFKPKLPTTTLTTVKPPTSISLADLDLPAWVTKLDLLSSIETLGTFYATKSLPEYAVPLYLQTLSILLPPTNANSGGRGAPPTASERCKAGLVMNNLSQLLSGSNIKDATSWAIKGLEVTDKTVQMAGFESVPESKAGKAAEVVQSSDERTQEVRTECLGVKLTLLYNLGVLNDMAGDKCQARIYFQKAYALADKMGGPASGVAKQKAAESLARLERRKSSKA
ncbi:hypothetical protein PHSY_004636 [Pseudozyma hubeiensis SY62]|uniref:Uncharacterized protein n=1 Tax=Pseudozyma hubeiensis (strain SY62) TaxID=1305764 RepID=R9P725_PSEHS|nr:hypothetical protein PHSY_004636 [Pseudozyma hubeiensis SY62]GAC97052.1 hypothetical protein PHSY_004636 [Pseudozyma hubeiensis SY62]